MSKENSEQLYFPAPDESQLTVRAIVIGCLIGGVVSAMNIYFGLRTGWGFGGSLIAAILSYSIFQLLSPKKAFGILETNIAQTAGSAAGSMSSAAGLVSAIPAMKMLGYDLGMGELFLWALSVAYLGVFYAVPLRNQMVIIEKLRFPTGTATAETIVAIFAKGEEALKKSKMLLTFAIAAGLLTLASYFIPAIGHPPVMKWIGLGAISAWGFSLLVSPMMYGAGILIGPRVGLSLLLGAVVSWGILGPYIVSQGWVSSNIMSYSDGPRGWILWPGVALMVTDALMSLLFSYKSVMNSFRRVSTKGMNIDFGEQIPKLWWMGGLGLSTILVTFIAQALFGIHPMMTMLAVAMSSILSMIATRSTGETDINPIGGMGKVTQIVFGGLAPGSLPTNLMCAAITGAGASQAGDMMQDLKTGHLLGASPKKQFKAQCLGILVGILFAIPIYKLFDSAYTIGDATIPAPAAHAWKAMAELLSVGVSAMPMHSLQAVIVACLVGIILACLKKFTPFAKFMPSALAMGIAFIVPAYYSVAMCFGSIALVIWQQRNADHCKAYAFAVASGLVAGEGLMGVVTAALTLLGIKPLF